MMSSNGRKTDYRHSSVLVESSRDDVLLGEALQSRLVSLRDNWLKFMGEFLDIPPYFVPDFNKFKKMRSRHSRGDFRHNEGEKKATRILAQWSVDRNCILRNQPLIKIEWGD
jgi:hypothetical protein